MFYIIVYDVDVSRVNKVHKFLRRYLYWVQNSVFEGELTSEEFTEICKGLERIIDLNEDSIVIYSFKNESSVNKKIIGKEKMTYSNIL